VNRVVIVPPSWIGEYNGTGLAAAVKYPDRFGVMGRFDPTAADAKAQLAGWLRQPGMLGIRMSFHIPPHMGWLSDGSLDWFWAEAERLGIPLMVLVPATSAKVAPIAERYPGLTLVIDHLGTYREVAGDAAFADLDNLLALARYPNVYAKASCMPVYSEEPYPYRDLHQRLRRVYDAFGPRRMMWGSDLTRLRGSYRQCVTLFTEALDFLSAEDKEWVMGRTLAEALRWPEA
jgi:predicted TIM-barrel fold metal-dependent hydrolase